MTNSCLEFHGLKDIWADNCEHCGRDHIREVEFTGIKTIKVRVQCDACCEAEAQLCKIRDGIAKTIRTRDELTPKQEDKRQRCEEVLKRCRDKRELVLSNIRNYFKEAKQQEQLARTPHND